jgi:hypothetical protein
MSEAVPESKQFENSYAHTLWRATVQVSLIEKFFFFEGIFLMKYLFVQMCRRRVLSGIHNQTMSSISL